MFCVPCVALIASFSGSSGGDIAAIDINGMIQEFYDAAPMDVTELQADQVSAWKAIDGGTDYWCGIRASGALACASEEGDHFDELSPPQDYTDYVQVEVQNDFGCGRRVGGSLVCWGKNTQGQADEPAGSFTDVSAGIDFACGVKTDGSLTCWGRDDDDQASPPSGTDFTDVACGRQWCVALKSDGSLAVWGQPTNSDPINNVPTTGTYTKVYAGKYTGYAIKSDGTLASWGQNYLGSITEIPAGVSSWYYINANPSDGSTCGVINDPGTSGYEQGTPICWGYHQHHEDPDNFCSN